MSAVGSFLRAYSVKQVAGVCAGLTGTVISVGVGLRQHLFLTHPVYTGACKQLEQSALVRELLRDEEISTRGVVAGYQDPTRGSASFQIPLVGTSSGISAVAYVEAEAEWVGRTDGAAETEKKQFVAQTRWLMRHLEVQLVGKSESEVLYSLPAALPPSPWAPSREPSILPRSVAALFPSWEGLKTGEATRWIGAGLFGLAMHVLGFSLLYRKSLVAKATTASLAQIRVPRDPQLMELRSLALRVAEAATGPIKAERERSASEFPDFYGARTPDEVAILSPILDEPDVPSKDLLFTAKRGESGWMLTRVATEEFSAKEMVFSRFDSFDNAAALREAVTRMVIDAKPHSLASFIADKVPPQQQPAPPLRPGMTRPANAKATKRSRPWRR